MAEVEENSADVEKANFITFIINIITMVNPHVPQKY